MRIDWSFRPKLADTLKNYSRQDFVADLIAGLTIGTVALKVGTGVGLFAPAFIPATGRAIQVIFKFMLRPPIAAHPI